MDLHDEANTSTWSPLPDSAHAGATFSLRLTELGVIKGATPSVADVLGHQPCALEGAQVTDMIHEDDLGALIGPWQDVVAHPRRSRSGRLRLRRADGAWQWFSSTSHNALADPAVGAMVSTYHDIHALVLAEQSHRARALSYRALAESTPVGIALLDEDGRVHFANRRLVTLLTETGLAAADLPLRAPGEAVPGSASRWSELIDRRFIAELAPLMRPDADTDEPRSRQISVEGAYGVSHHLLVSTATIRNAAGCNVVVSLQDVSDEVCASRAHDRLVQVVDEVDDVVLVVDLQGRISYMNRAAAKFLDPALTGQSLLSHLDDDLRAVAAKVVDPHFRGARRWSGDLDVADRSGTIHTMATAIRPVVDRERPDVHIGVTMRDVTAERAHARQLAHQARHDLLTGLPNRLSLMESLDALRAGDHGGDVAICFIDLDNLKIVNDGLGHGAGDRLLVAVAAELAPAAQPYPVARFGGDEFVVIAEGLDADGAMAVAERLLAAMGQVQVVGVSSHISASIGVALAPLGGLDPESLVRDADSAMYAAKRAGRSRCALFDEPLREQAARRFLLESSLRQALDDGGLDVALQPVIALADGCVSGLEALSRWSSAAPREFISIAEESGLIVELGQAMLARTLCDVATIRASSPDLAELRIGVNVSGRELDEPSFAERTLATIEASGIPASDVVLELTETVLIHPREDVDQTLRRLRDAGLALALDDFGVGYSSLTYLRRYPIDILKLDVSYTQALSTDSETRIIAEAMVSMARRLDLDVVAEGVETPEQLAVVSDLGVKWVQGYLVGRPASAAELLASDLTGPRRQVTEGR